MKDDRDEQDQTIVDKAVAGRRSGGQQLRLGRRRMLNKKSKKTVMATEEKENKVRTNIPKFSEKVFIQHLFCMVFVNRIHRLISLSKPNSWSMKY